MKTEAEIRRHRNNLLACIALPCHCAAGGHAEECRIGGLMMEATAQTLSWILGERPEMQEMVEETARQARVAREGN